MLPLPIRGREASIPFSSRCDLIRIFGDWLVVNQVLRLNPAAALLGTIDRGSLAGIRDRALLRVMLYSFATGERGPGDAAAGKRHDVQTHDGDHGVPVERPPEVDDSLPQPGRGAAFVSDHDTFDLVDRHRVRRSRRMTTA